MYEIVKKNHAFLKLFLPKLFFIKNKNFSLLLFKDLWTKFVKKEFNADPEFDLFICQFLVDTIAKMPEKNQLEYVSIIGENISSQQISEQIIKLLFCWWKNIIQAERANNFLGTFDKLITFENGYRRLLEGPAINYYLKGKLKKNILLYIDTSNKQSINDLVFKIVDSSINYELYLIYDITLLSQLLKKIAECNPKNDLKNDYKVNYLFSRYIEILSYHKDQIAAKKQLNIEYDIHKKLLNNECESKKMIIEYYKTLYPEDIKKIEEIFKNFEQISI